MEFFSRRLLRRFGSHVCLENYSVYTSTIRHRLPSGVMELVELDLHDAEFIEMQRPFGDQVVLVFGPCVLGERVGRFAVWLLGVRNENIPSYAIGDAALYSEVILDPDGRGFNYNILMVRAEVSITAEAAIVEPLRRESA